MYVLKKLRKNEIISHYYRCLDVKLPVTCITCCWLPAETVSVETFIMSLLSNSAISNEWTIVGKNKKEKRIVDNVTAIPNSPKKSDKKQISKGF